MSNSFMSPLPTFTLETLMTDGRWMAAQGNSSKKAAGTKNDLAKKTPRTSARADKSIKTSL